MGVAGMGWVRDRLWDLHLDIGQEQPQLADAAAARGPSDWLDDELDDLLADTPPVAPENRFTISSYELVCVGK